MFPTNPTESRPNFVERKGTLFLRSDHKKYSRDTLASGWHAARESEPKDYDISTSSDKERNLLKATYNRIGNMADPSFFPATTAQEAMNEGQELKERYTEKETRQQMISIANFSIAANRIPNSSNDFGYNSILPRHNPDHDKQHLATTQRLDYQYHLPWTPNKEDTGIKSWEETSTHRRRLSEFTDTTGHRRKGINVWQDYKEQ
ncbi:PREDICTED: uncharacterized protein C9orf135-like [Amphimedon queenslandica]|uniref:Uncharacterized protein n=1 Tax=Amphimedon queenslandica TaxID=400682 RepID=A0A1X7UHU1_AMPQE|nr:PREDICTED: uncharacterized protein C9orf135-like [Amphimedon queenslandica]|eukprot:XP_003387881.1 PREDICTED: uncharacterized protein C9orf135-like [Amphimedon queenslandica]